MNSSIDWLWGKTNLKRLTHLSKWGFSKEETAFFLTFIWSRFGLSKDQGKFALPTFSTEGTELALLRLDEDSDCSNVNSGIVNCDSLGQFRTQDGSCNNIRHPNWGRANIALTRLLPPDYEDGIQSNDVLCVQFLYNISFRQAFRFPEVFCLTARVLCHLHVYWVRPWFHMRIGQIETLHSFWCNGDSL